MVDGASSPVELSGPVSQNEPSTWISALSQDEARTGKNVKNIISGETHNKQPIW